MRAMELHARTAKQSKVRKRVAAEWVSSGYIAENKKFQIKVRELNDLLKEDRRNDDAS